MSITLTVMIVLQATGYVKTCQTVQFKHRLFVGMLITPQKS